MADSAVDRSQKIPVLEKIGYSLGDSAANFVFLTMVCFQQGFYTDVMGLSGTQAGLAILIPRLWDAFFDPIMGGLADRTRTRWGRFRPWILWTAVPWSIVMVLAYFTPEGLSKPGMLIWAMVTNTVLMTLYSSNNMPYAALGGVMSSDQTERNKLNAYRFVAVMVAQWIVVTFTLVLRDKFAGPHPDQHALAHGWTSTMGLWSVVCLVCFLITFATAKERVKPVAEAAFGPDGAPKAKRSIVTDLADLMKNNPWKIMFIVTFGHFALLSFQGSAGYQYFTRYADSQACYDVLHKIGLTAPDLKPTDSPSGFMGSIGYMIPGPRETASGSANSALYGIVGTVGKIANIIGIIFAPFLAKRFGKKAVVIVGFFLSVIGNVLFYFLGKNDVGAMLVLTGVIGLVYGPTIPLVWAIFADVVDFGEWKLGHRATGMVFATIGFALKSGLAFGGAAFSWIEEYVGYDATHPSEAILQTFRSCNTLAAAGFFVFCLAFMFAYPLNKHKTQQISDDLAERRKKAETGAAAVATA